MSKKFFNFFLRILLWINALAWILLMVSYISYTDSKYKEILEYKIYFTILVVHSFVFAMVAIMSRNSSSKYFLTVTIYFTFTTFIFYEMVAQDFFNDCLEIGYLEVKICLLSKIFFGEWETGFGETYWRLINNSCWFRRPFDRCIYLRHRILHKHQKEKSSVQLLPRPGTCSIASDNFE